MSELTLRETVAMAVNDSEVLRDLGLPADAVFQADQADSPTMRPFVVLRWLEQQRGLAHIKRNPFTAWVYDERGDNTRAEYISDGIGEVLSSLMGIQTKTGWILEIEKGERGADLDDDGFEALVVPRNMVAIASGV